MRVVGATLGSCVHVAGLVRFLRLAEGRGHHVEFLGAAWPPARVVAELARRRPDLVGLSYRLSPEAAGALFAELGAELARAGLRDLRLAFGGTPPVAEVARASGLFEQVFSGEERPGAVEGWLEGRAALAAAAPPPQRLVERVASQAPVPLLRHHLGLNTVADTVEHAGRVAAAGVLDVLSLAPDQNAQEYFFRPDEMPSTGHGAGGVPLRSRDDLVALHRATRCGNHPLVRCYAGTRDLERWAAMCLETIDIAWGAVPLFWYSELDRRSTRPLEDAIRENQAAMRWYAAHGVPLEVNDPHQWGLRDAHDALFVATAYLAAYNARAAGARVYVSQYMLNTPPSTSPAMDLAKMLAAIELVESLHGPDFTSYRQIRTGLSSMPADPDLARGHLSASLCTGMALRPHIVHVVGACEATHRATALDVIEGCRLARGAIDHALLGLPDPVRQADLQRRRRTLVREANLLLRAVAGLRRGGHADPLTDPALLARAVREGLLDAPHLWGSGVAPGAVVTVAVDGAVMAVDPRDGRPLSEVERLRSARRRTVAAFRATAAKRRAPVRGKE